MSFWANKQVLVTGGTGFIGSHLVELLLEQHAKVRTTARLKGRNSSWLGSCKDRLEFVQGDLLDYDFCGSCCNGIDLVMHAAGKIAGLPYNAAHPAEMLSTNLKIDSNVIGAAAEAGVKRYLYISGVTVYPPGAPVPTPESQGLVDLPDPSVRGASWAKRIGELQAQFFAAEHGMEVAIARLCNVYGPRDDFADSTAHVIGSVIRDTFRHRRPTIWGDGEQSRSYLYVADAVRGLMSVTEKYAEADPINIGSEEEIAIKDLVQLILALTQSDLQIAFQGTRPVGHKRRLSDTRKAQAKLGFRPEVSLKSGLERTIQWYRNSEWMKT